MEFARPLVMLLALPVLAALWYRRRRDVDPADPLLLDRHRVDARHLDRLLRQSHARQVRRQRHSRPPKQKPAPRDREGSFDHLVAHPVADYERIFTKR